MRILDRLRASKVGQRFRNTRKAILPAWRGEVTIGQPLGHFYSPVPNRYDIEMRYADGSLLFSEELPGIDLREEAQLELIDRIAGEFSERPFDPIPGQYRYNYENSYFGPGDAIMLNGVMRVFEPKRVVEIGSGYSSAAVIDTCEKFLSDPPKCTFIEPFPSRLQSLLKDSDWANVELVDEPAQELSFSYFSDLRKDDILFIDSTHVSRVNSDVNFELLEIIPRLPPGVVIHVHDIFFPFEYPREWLEEGRHWTEAYLLRALLTGNTKLEIILWNDFLSKRHAEEVGEKIPNWTLNTGGSIWLRTK